MTKKKTSPKQKFSSEDIPKLTLKNQENLAEFLPEKAFKVTKNVGEALLQCLLENDTESFIEILDSYLRVNRSYISKTGIARSTVQQALSKKGNPTLRTIAKIVHESARK